MFAAKVKNVISGDTVVLVPTKTNQFPVPERLLTLSYVRGQGYDGKEALRQLLIGKEIKFNVLFKMPTSGKEFGDIKAPIFDSLVEYALEKGWVKLKDNNGHDNEEYVEKLQQIENKAKLLAVGVWSSTPEPEVVPLTESIIEKSQKAPITTVVEKVISADRIMARILVNKSQHVSTPLILAGIKAPRTDDPDNTKVALQGKQFVEDKLLTTRASVKVKIVGENQAGLPLAVIEHPSGNNLHQALLENGFAEVVDWQSGLLGSGVMGGLRKAEQTARALGRGLYAMKVAGAAPATASAGASAGKPLSKLQPGSTIDITVAKIINVDTLVVRTPADVELTVQLSSLRGPRPNDTTLTNNSVVQQAVVNTAREFVRHQAIGKTGSMYIDGLRAANPDLGLDQRWLVSIKLNGSTDLSELIVQNGWAGVIRHNKATSHERSMNWDRLIELEESVKKQGKKGIYFSGDINKILTVGTRIVDASENFSKAKAFFNGFQQKGRISGGYYVEFVSGVNRVKLFNPKEGTKLTLVLGGLSNDKSSTADQGVKLLNKRILQKPVEFEVYDTDKIGGFVGNLFINSKALTPIQTVLLEQGFARVNDIGLSKNPYSAELIKAEDAAKAVKKGVWVGFDPSQVEAPAEALENLNIDVKPQFFDIEITDIDASGLISYHQLNAAGSFAGFKKDFAAFHSQLPSASQASADLPFNLQKAPKKGELVSAKFTENGKYYRAKVVNFDKATSKYEVKHVDFGNIDKVPFSSLRTLPARFNLASFPAFAHTTRLQNIKLPPATPTDYLTDAIYALEDLTFDKKLVISALPSTEPGVEFTGVLYDSEQSLKDPDYTINKQLVSEGWGIVLGTNVKPSLKPYIDQLKVAEKLAKSNHAGCWEFGDVSYDDEEPL